MSDRDNPANLLRHLSALNQEDTKEELAADLDMVLDISPQPDDMELAAAEGEGPTSEVHKLSERLAASETKKTRLKHLLANLLDLIQQQNESISEKDKRNKALKLENDSLKSQVTRMERRITQERRMSQRRNTSNNPTPAINVPPPNDPGTSTRDAASDDDNLVTRMERRITQERRMSQRRNSTINPSPAINVPPPSVPGPSTRDVATDDDNLKLFNSLTELLMPEDGTNPYNIYYF